MKIYVWGTGILVGKVVGTYLEIGKIEAFIDNNEKKYEFMGKKVYLPEKMVDVDYDAIIVITIYSKEIYEQAQKLGLDIDKFIFVYDNFSLQDINRNYELAREIFGENYSNLIQNRYQIIRKNEETIAVGNKINAGYTQMDYVRIKCFELVTEEIEKRKIEGQVAEVGVFRGEFAQYINAAFPDKKLYLFDTFEGFNPEEATREVKDGNATDTFVEVYKDTNVKNVLDRMAYPEQVEIRKGLFPSTLNGLDEQFTFVSIDVDFEQSIYDCLTYFYPRLVKGGYIFIHDYNSALRGVRKAVERYEKDNGMICKMPLCDANGTLAIMK